MAKTELTKHIESCISGYMPNELGGVKFNYFRGKWDAFEVCVESGTTKSGITDCVRIAEYFANVQPMSVCQWHYWKKDGMELSPEQCPVGRITEKEAPRLCENNACKWNGKGKMVGNNSVVVVCFEIKISVSDFKSRHGHNLVGNLNFYVIPKEIYPSVHHLVPDGIGVIVFNGSMFSPLRIKKDCEFRQMDDEQQKWAILSVMKRWALNPKPEPYRKMEIQQEYQQLTL